MKKIIIVKGEPDDDSIFIPVD